MPTNTKSSILESLALIRGLEFGNETLHFDCGINLSRCGIEKAGCYGELWLRPLSQDLFSARVRYNPLGLPAGLGNLPLHEERDGWYLVLGSWNCTTENPEKANKESKENNLDILLVPVNPRRNARLGPILICQYHKCSGNRLAILPRPSCTGYIILACALPSNSGPNSCAPGQFTSDAPNCSWPGTFKAEQALNRHYRAKHLNDRVDCPVGGCLYVGGRGIKRADNLPAHLLNKHGISCTRPLYGN